MKGLAMMQVPRTYSVWHRNLETVSQRGENAGQFLHGRRNPLSGMPSGTRKNSDITISRAQEHTFCIIGRKG